VFKVIRDKFADTKAFSRETVKDRYFLVKKHDRVGRMADTLEYSNVALPINRFAPELLAELQSSIGNSIIL
jgi:isocitrate dehydrogenase kinase/phosphatase